MSVCGASVCVSGIKMESVHACLLRRGETHLNASRGNKQNTQCDRNAVRNNKPCLQVVSFTLLVDT